MPLRLPCPRRLAACSAILAGLAAAPSAAQLVAPDVAADRVDVDLELVLLVDVSPSLDLDEFEIQRAGYVEAFRHDDVQDAILSGPYGQIAVTYVEWGGPYEQVQIAPWTLIASREDAAEFASALDRGPLYGGSRTSISNALMYSAELIGGNEYDGLKRVIDISGDGPNNSGPRVDLARDVVATNGITINGLPLVLRDDDPIFNIPNLDQYYEDCVIAGSGSFSTPVTSLDQLGAAIRSKLVLEIAWAEPRLQPAQFLEEAPRDKADCLIGEKLYQGSGFR